MALQMTLPDWSRDGPQIPYCGTSKPSLWKGLIMSRPRIGYARLLVARNERMVVIYTDRREVIYLGHTSKYAPCGRLSELSYRFEPHGTIWSYTQTTHPDRREGWWGRGVPGVVGWVGGLGGLYRHPTQPIPPCGRDEAFWLIGPTHGQMKAILRFPSIDLRIDLRIDPGLTQN